MGVVFFLGTAILKLRLDGGADRQLKLRGVARL
jgi:hypothetical protein